MESTNHYYLFCGHSLAINMYFAGINEKLAGTNTIYARKHTLYHIWNVYRKIMPFQCAEKKNVPILPKNYCFLKIMLRNAVASYFNTDTNKNLTSIYLTSNARNTTKNIQLKWPNVIIQSSSQCFDFFTVHNNQELMRTRHACGIKQTADWGLTKLNKWLGWQIVRNQKLAKTGLTQ